MGKIYLGDELLAYDVDSALDSGSTNPVGNSALTEALDNKLDKVNFINQMWPKGSVYITYEYKNPSEILGGEWELIGGEDANKNYYPAFAIDTDTAGTTINESLPNIKGTLDDNYLYVDASKVNGAFRAHATGTCWWGNQSGNWPYGLDFNAHNSNSTYQDGAHVNVNAIKLFHWRRTDDGTIVEQITPLDVDVEDVLWEGSQGAATNVTITLSDSIGDYKYLKFYSRKDENNMVDNVDVKDINVTTSSLEIIKEHGWDSALRYFRFHKTSDTTFEMDLVDLTLYKITGVRAIPSTDIGVEVQDVLWEGATTAEASANLTLAKSALNYDELRFIAGNASTWNNNTQEKALDLSEYRRIKAAGGGVLVAFAWDSTARFINGLTISSDGTTCSFWCSGCSVRKIIGVKRPHISTISAGNGINVSNTGEISSTVTFKNYYVNVNMTTQGSFGGTITCDSGFVPLGLGSTSIRTDGAVGYGYCDNIAKLSDTQYRFTGWCNPNGTSGSGASSITIYATFVKNATVLNNY